MTYYKVLSQDGFIGVGSTYDLIRYQKKHNLILSSSEEKAECISINGKFYHDVWMRPFESEYEFEQADVPAITKEEYDALKEAIDKGEEIREPQPEEEPVEEEPVEVAETPEEEVTAEFVRDIKIKELSLECNKAITAGFDLELSDGEQHHFSMSLEDQANLNTASMQILGGDEEIPYHADGEEYKMFSSEDMISVIGAANQHKLKELAYFGCLKTWVSGLVRIKSIQEVKYGDEIPKRYQSALYKRTVE